MKQLIRRVKQSERILLDRFPKAFDLMKDYRAHLLTESSWSTGYMPMVEVISAASALLQIEKSEHAGYDTWVDGALSDTRTTFPTYVLSQSMLCLYSWRFTKRAYEIDPTLLQTLLATPIPDTAPIEVVSRIPEWCMLIKADIPFYDVTFGNCMVNGFLVLFSPPLVYEDGEEVGFPTINFMVYTDKMGVVNTSLGLNSPSVKASLEHARNSARKLGIPDVPDGEVDGQSALLKAMLTLTLYFCSDDPEYVGGIPGGKPKLGVKGKFDFPKNPRIIQVGKALGAKLKAQSSQAASSIGKKPHMRKAHWHGVWTGPRNDPANPQKFKLNWIPPTFVNCDLTSI